METTFFLFEGAEVEQKFPFSYRFNVGTACVVSPSPFFFRIRGRGKRKAKGGGGYFACAVSPLTSPLRGCRGETESQRGVRGVSCFNICYGYVK